MVAKLLPKYVLFTLPDRSGVEIACVVLGQSNLYGRQNYLVTPVAGQGSMHVRIERCRPIKNLDGYAISPANTPSPASTDSITPQGAEPAAV